MIVHKKIVEIETFHILCLTQPWQIWLNVITYSPKCRVSWRLVTCKNCKKMKGKRPAPASSSQGEKK